jgi:hypothetical protein
MRSFGRIVLMLVVSVVALTVCGGARNWNEFGFVGSLVVMFWGLPLLGFITLCHFLDKRFDGYARYPIALIGLFPLALVTYFKGQGDPRYINAIVLAGLAWSAAWLATSLIVYRAPRAELTV